MAKRNGIGPGMVRRSGPAGERHLRERSVRKSLPSALPLVHATAAFFAGEILRAGRFETRKCRVFGHKMIYFFVMRTDYRSRDGDEKSHRVNAFPAIFIMRPAITEVPFHVYPFDTGAGHVGIFSDQADPFIPLNDYELDQSLEASVGHIEWAFGTAADYFEGRLRADVRDGVPIHETVTRSFLDVAQMGRKGSNAHDRRASAVEIAIDHDVALKGNVLLAILPDKWLEDEGVRNIEVLRRLAAQEIKVKTYEWRPNTPPNEYQEIIVDIARKWYRKHEWL